MGILQNASAQCTARGLKSSDFFTILFYDLNSTREEFNISCASVMFIHHGW